MAGPLREQIGQLGQLRRSDAPVLQARHLAEDLGRRAIQADPALVQHDDPPGVPGDPFQLL